MLNSADRTNPPIKSCQFEQQFLPNQIADILPGFYSMEQPLASGQLGFVIAAAENPIITNLVKAVRQYVQQKSPDELDRPQLHDLLFMVSTDHPGKVDLIVFDINDAMVADG